MGEASHRHGPSHSLGRISKAGTRPRHKEGEGRADGGCGRAADVLSRLSHRWWTTYVETAPSGSGEVAEVPGVGVCPFRRSRTDSDLSRSLRRKPSRDALCRDSLMQGRRQLVLPSAKISTSIKRSGGPFPKQQRHATPPSRRGSGAR